MAVNIGVNIQRSPNRINQALRAAGVNGQYPKLLFDFDDEYYLTNGSSKTFANAMTFARAGNATMVDSDGKIKWAPHNLIKYSEEFDIFAWSKTNLTVTDNAATAPDGTLTADLLTPDTGNFNRFLQNNSAVITGDYVSYYIWAKSNGAQWVRLTIKTTGDHCVWFDLNAGAKGTEVGVVSSSITEGSDGWYLLGITVSSAASDGVIFGVTNADNGTIYDGDDSKQVYVWGAHVYRSDLGGMVNNPDRNDSYVPTTSSAVYLPRRGHHKYNGDQWVNKGLLVESEARTNLLPYSEDVSHSGWTKNTIGITQEADSFGINMWSISDSSTTSFAQISEYTSVLTENTNFSLSILVKKDSSPTSQFGARINFSNGTTTQFCGQSLNVDDGTFYGSWSAFRNSSIVEDWGTHWRMIVTGTVGAGYTSVALEIFPAHNDTNGGGSSANTGTHVIGGIQLEFGSTPSSYIPTNGSSVTRAAETVTVPYANLPWPTPTYIGDELVTNGTFDTDTSGWTLSGATASIVSQEVQVTSTAAYGGLYQEFSTEVGKVYEFGVTSRKQTAFQARARVYNNDLSVILATIDNTTTSNLDQTATFVATSTTSRIKLEVGDSSTGRIVYFDNISVREINPLSVSIAMMGELTYSDDNSYTDSIMFDWNFNSDNYFQHRISTFGALTGQVNFVSKAGGVADIVYSDDVYQAGLNVPFSFASRHGSTFVNGAVDGIALTADTTPVALPDLSTTDLKLAFKYNGTISEFRIFDRDIGDAGIAEATKPSLEPSLSLTFDGQPSSFTNTGLTS